MTLATVQIDQMRQRGMSDTAIRRAFGLSCKEASQYGLATSVVHSSQPPEPEPDPIPEPGPPETNRGPLMVDVLTAVADAGGVSRADILSISQVRGLTPLRHLTMYLLRELCSGASFAAIGHFLGRDQTSAHYSYTVARNRLSREPKFRKIHDDACRALRRRCGVSVGVWP